VHKEQSATVFSRVVSSSGEGDLPTATADVLLPPDLVLKLTALSILSSYSLRQLGKHYKSYCRKMQLLLYIFTRNLKQEDTRKLIYNTRKYIVQEN